MVSKKVNFYIVILHLSQYCKMECFAVVSLQGNEWQYGGKNKKAAGTEEKQVPPI